MRFILSALLFVALLFAKPAKAVDIRVNKTVLFAGSDIIITCVVPRHEDNRKIEALLLPDYTSSEHQLDGSDRDAITHNFPFKRVPVDVTSAACQLTDKYDNHAHAIQPLQVEQP